MENIKTTTILNSRRVIQLDTLNYIRMQNPYFAMMTNSDDIVKNVIQTLVQLRDPLGPTHRHERNEWRLLHIHTTSRPEHIYEAHYGLADLATIPRHRKLVCFEQTYTAFPAFNQLNLTFPTRPTIPTVEYYICRIHYIRLGSVA